MVDIAIESPRQADILGLLDEGDAAALALYPAENYYGLDVAALEKPGVVLFVARSEGTALGTAALVDNGDGTTELKRMFVSPAARGLGVASTLLTAVEAYALSLGATTVLLETGHPQVAAIALYEKHGYGHIPQFGQYVGDPTSVCMKKVVA